MSRSYKKTPIVKDNCRYKKLQKRKANKTVRQRLKDPEYKIQNGNSYQKEYQSYNISDYVIRWTKEEAIAEYEKYCKVEYYSNLEKYDPDLPLKAMEDFKKKYPTLEDWLNYWEKCMRRK